MSACVRACIDLCVCGRVFVRAFAFLRMCMPVWVWVSMCVTAFGSRSMYRVLRMGARKTEHRKYPHRDPQTWSVRVRTHGHMNKWSTWMNKGLSPFSANVSPFLCSSRVYWNGRASLLLCCSCSIRNLQRGPGDFHDHPMSFSHDSESSEVGPP